MAQQTIPDGRIDRDRTVDPARLTAAERQDLTDRLFAVHQAIFAGVSRDDFQRHVIAPPADRTLIRLYAAEGRIVGYCALHWFRRHPGGRGVTVLRAEAGLMPAYRGRGRTYGFGMIHALAERLRHPFTPLYYLGTLVHSSSYHLFCKYFPRVYPHPALGMPEEVRALALTLVDSFPDPAVDPADPLVRDVRWITIESPQETALNGRDDLGDVRFFRQRNPGYVRGDGLVVLVPLSIANIATALARRAAERIGLAITRRHPKL